MRRVKGTGVPGIPFGREAKGRESVDVIFGQCWLEFGGLLVEVDLDDIEPGLG